MQRHKSRSKKAHSTAFLLVCWHFMIYTACPEVSLGHVSSNCDFLAKTILAARTLASSSALVFFFRSNLEPPKAVRLNRWLVSRVARLPLAARPFVTSLSRKLFGPLKSPALGSFLATKLVQRTRLRAAFVESIGLPRSSAEKTERERACMEVCGELFGANFWHPCRVWISNCMGRDARGICQELGYNT